MQFFRIAAYVQVAQLYGLVHYAACTFCHIEMACGLLLLVSIAYRAVLCVIGLYGRWENESVSVFDGFVFISVDVNLFVNVFIYYNCMGRLSVRVYMIVCALVSACCLGGDWWSMAAIRRELNLFVNCFFVIVDIYVCDNVCVNVNVIVYVYDYEYWYEKM